MHKFIYGGMHITDFNKDEQFLPVHTHVWFYFFSRDIFHESSKYEG